MDHAVKRACKHHWHSGLGPRMRPLGFYVAGQAPSFFLTFGETAPTPLSTKSSASQRLKPTNPAPIFLPTPDERSDFGEGPSSDRLASNGKSSALGIGQSKSLGAELLLENSVLLLEIFDDRVLLVGDPSGQRGNEDLPGLKNDCHPEIVVLDSRNRQLFVTAGIRLFFPGFCSAE